MKRKRLYGGVALAGIAVAGVCWATGWPLGGEDPEVRELQQLRDQAFKQSDDMSDEDRTALRGEMRNRMQNLTDGQRQQFFAAGRNMFMTFAQQRLGSFFELPPAEQQAKLDEMIDRMAEWRQRREREGSEAVAGGGGTAGRGGPGGDWSNRSEAERDAFRKQMLDKTNPKLRAQFGEFRRLMNARLEARGMEPMNGPPRGMFR